MNPCVFHCMSEFEPSVYLSALQTRAAPVTWKVSCCLLVFVQRKCIITAAIQPLNDEYNIMINPAWAKYDQNITAPEYNTKILT